MNLKDAVIEQLGDKEYLHDVANHGADGGFPGFTYYTDTCQFYQDHKTLINDYVAEMAESMGTSAVELVASFSCLNGDWSIDEVAKVMYGKERDDQIENALAWFALEEIAFSESE